MSQNLGHALSIVGGLVVGQAAVEARIVSAPVLIITALCGIAGLMVPRLKGAVFYCKIFLIITSAVFGLYGFFAGLTILHCHLYSLTSFGVDYVSPSLEFSLSSLKDTLIRAPLSKMTTRPASLTGNIIRLKIKK
jgi:spore germination protein KA